MSINIQLDCTKATIEARNHASVLVYIEDADEGDFDKREIASCVSIKTFIEAYGIADILDFITDEYNGELMEHIENLS